MFNFSFWSNQILRNCFVIVFRESSFFFYPPKRLFGILSFIFFSGILNNLRLFFYRFSFCLLNFSVNQMIKNFFIGGISCSSRQLFLVIFFIKKMNAVQMQSPDVLNIRERINFFFQKMQIF